MATLAVIFTSEKPIPDTTDRTWLAQCCAWMHGTYMAWIRLRREVPEAQRPKVPWFDAESLTTNAATYMGVKTPESKAACEAYVREKHAAWVAAGMPNTRGWNGPREYCEVSGAAPALGLDDLTGFRGGILAPVAQAKLGTGAARGFVANLGDPFAFDIDHELALCEELVRASDGECVVLWTWGHTIQIHHIRIDDGATQRTHLSLRLATPSDRPRAARTIASLRREFEGSRFAPDFKVIETLLAGPEIGIEPWFRAFGAAGAAELVPADAPAKWGALDAVGTALLRGETPAAADLKVLNSLLVAIGGDKLPSKPSKDITRKLGDAAWRLKRSTGVPPTSSLWRDRYQAARLYWEIVESDALDHLTTGNDTKGKGASASLGRLAAYYPL